ncbi:hypothetical protein AWM70_03255 [Paenibacillus yonginensis]|uniref:Phage protein Gp138 N-terminal domain-containing protein n=1 Tax=Paenibacillus yonginensis TaxID=1462996 RepID=A0A1B1MWZ8_9BACL|nr:Gp138 family membrane-puncturing spike protein [Paenibacillus yonginensis]ANS73711.1 hypothetical protein AWM70_03255 [Paenibacillus yonginensis]
MRGGIVNNDPSGVLYQAVSGLMNAKLSQVRVGLACRVVSFDPSSCTADIQPLIRTAGNDPAMIHNVPVLGQRLMLEGTVEELVYKPRLKTGDLVFAVCADRELKNARTGQVAAPDTGRRHSVNDAVIVGVFSWSL